MPPTDRSWTLIGRVSDAYGVYTLLATMVSGASFAVSTILVWWADPSTTLLGKVLIALALGFTMALLGLLLIGSAGWAYHRWSADSPLQEPITQQPTIGRLIGAPRIEWTNDGRVALKGRYEHSGRDLVVYVAYSSVGGPNHLTLTGVINARAPREKVSIVGRFDQGEVANIDIGYVFGVEGNQEVLQWGGKDMGGTKVGVTWGSYFGHIILVESSGVQHGYPFAVIARSFKSSPASPLILGPDLLTSHSKMMAIKGGAQFS